MSDLVDPSTTLEMYEKKFPREHLVFKFPHEPKKDPPLSHKCVHTNTCQRQMQNDFINGSYKTHELDIRYIYKAARNYTVETVGCAGLTSNQEFDYLDFLIKKNFTSILMAKSSYTWHAHSPSLLPLSSAKVSNDLLALYQLGLCCGFCHNPAVYTPPKMPISLSPHTFENYFCGCYNDTLTHFIPSSEQLKMWERGEIGLFIPYYYNNVILPYLAILKQNLTFMAFDFDTKSQDFVALSASRVNAFSVEFSYCAGIRSTSKWDVADRKINYRSCEIIREAKIIYRRLIRRLFLELTSHYYIDDLILR